jgi:hypothetical protein
MEVALVDNTHRKHATEHNEATPIEKRKRESGFVAKRQESLQQH